MAASYTTMEYTGFAVAVGLGGMVLITVLGILLIRRLGAKFKNPALTFALFLVPVFAMILLCSWLIPNFNQTGDLLIPGEYVVRTTAGEIESVTHREENLVHFRNGAFRGGEEILIDGFPYYVISEGVLTEGMYIELQYAQFENNVILNWQEVTPERAAQVRAESLLTETETPAEEPQPEVSPESEFIGTWLSRIGVFGFLALLGLNTAFKQKFVTNLLIQDALVKGEIKPNRSALLRQILPVACISLIVLGIVIGSGYYSALVIFVMGVGVMAAIMGADATTGLKLDGSTFTIRRLGKDKTYRIGDVQAVFWRRSRGLVGKTMVLVLNDGKSYWFHMDSFSGVEGVYRYISRYLEDAQQ